ncbi:MAG TPA: SpvB/TcaC N-terminal domain-containing protein [Steroidobacteraceae bacterium]|jgi:RHS repeat-associated protein
MEQGDQKTDKSGERSVSANPSISLPKGGGAIRGIGEKFAANPVTGTGTLTVPVYASPGRSGFGPRLALSYDSGEPNTTFGFGWSLSLPSITRKTDKGLPQYRDAEESDTFILSGAEDLVPALLCNSGTWIRDAVQSRAVYGQKYAIHRYRPRVEGLFARIERWLNITDPSDTFWRSISRDNITTWYGKTAESRIADSDDSSRVFSWLICETYDDKGNLIVYRYKPEDSVGVDLSQVHERNRTDISRSPQRYIKSVFYGNRTPYFPDLTAARSAAQPTDWCFQLVFDYGEHDLSVPLPQDTAAPWTCRLDLFSSYRSCFEVRTYRLCRRVLMFHHFADQSDVGLNCLVRSTDLLHATAPPPDPSQPFYSYLLSATQTGYVRQGAGYLSSSLPPLEFEYTAAVIDERVRDVDADSLRNLPEGLASAQYRWVDLNGEGVSGVLTEQDGSWYYKPNLSPANLQMAAGETITLPRLGPMKRVARQPSPATLASSGVQLMDLSGDGRLDVVAFEGACPGYFERTDEGNWEPFRVFRSLPVVEWRSPNLKFVDLTGDGFPDLLIGEDAAFWWYPSLSVEGFGPAQRVAQALDEEKGPKLVFADNTESIFLADLSGDGLTDLVRIRNGDVCYWPNLGYGRFGAKITMDNSPRFDRADLFDGRRIRLADIDGSGTADMVYFAGNAIHLYFNQSGNRWGGERNLAHYPAVESLSSAVAIDLLGNGTACLVWSSPLPGSAQRPMRYIDLMGGQKPHLLVRSRNNLGAETVVQYAPSTRFYVADKLAGTPWLTRLPFPVHVVERVETYDYISRNRFVMRYAYHHGYYDGVEREFRGFGRVDQWDTQEIGTFSPDGSFPAAANEDPSSSVPPVWTKTWFHTGAYFGELIVSRHFEREYYREGDASEGLVGLTPAQMQAMSLDDTLLPSAALLPDGSRVPTSLSPEELREACRALRGSILRQEVYSLDGSDRSDRPYSASERNYTLEVLQPRGPNRYGAFVAHARESIEFQYERALFKVKGNTLADPTAPSTGIISAADPRVTHAITLAVDPYGNVLQSASIGYGRRFLDPTLTPTDQGRQLGLLATCTASTYTNLILVDDSYRTPLPAESSTYELIRLQPDASQPGLTNLFRFDELQAKIAQASDGAHDIPFETLVPTGLAVGQFYRRLLERTRAYYRPDDLGSTAGDPKALLALQTVESLALPGVGYQLAFTPGLITQIYQRDGSSLLPTPASVLGSVGPDGGGYVDVDGDGLWWMPSGRTYYQTAAATATLEKTEAQEHFYLPRRFEDAFGNAVVADYDPPNDLLLTRTSDALNNTVSVVNDYRVLAPSVLTDPNGNRSAVAFDALGLVAGTAVMGKSSENLGDSLGGFSADLAQSQIDAFYAADDPHTLAAALLGTATTRIVYDPTRFQTSRAAAPTDPSQWQPVFAATLARETHVSDLALGQTSKIQISFGYSDGYGREIQKKIQAEPGAVVDKGPVINPRWVGSGWTIFNNKGKPVRQYEPFFSQLPTKGHQFEYGMQVGVSPILLYDPVERVVATLHPNHTYEKVVFDPWGRQSWDANDTVLQVDPTVDPDVGDFFKLLPAADCLPTWYTQRAAGGLGAQEQTAASKAAAHANTPVTARFDTLGRVFLTVADNGSDGKFPSRVDLDIQGNQRAMRDAIVQAGDAQGRVVMRYDYDMRQQHLHQASMEAGERWLLSDALGNSIRAWDCRAHNFRTEYDTLRRPTGLFIRGSDAVNSDPRTLAAEVLYQKATYGEGQPAALNLRTRIFQHSDTAGIVTNTGTNPVTSQAESYDFKGNLLRSTRGIFADYKALPDLGAPPATPDVFTGSTQYDALNRPTAITMPDDSVVHPSYNEANLLETVSVNLRGAATMTLFVTNIDYDAKGQRVLIAYGNNASTAYTYDPLTFRLSHLTTSRAGFPTDQQSVQDLAYTYDPVGNVIHIQDDADIQNTVYFRNQRVEPSADYTYDAIYRLIQASGREQLGLSAGNPSSPLSTSYNDVPRVGLISPGDGKAMGTYSEQYQYDAVGNFLNLVHRGANPANPGWTRSYTYNEASLLETPKQSNRLSSATVSGSQSLTEPYGYDLHGNMTHMPQLHMMQWDFHDQLQLTQRQAVNPSDEDGTLHQGERTYYVYDASGQRIRKTTESSAGLKTKERLYLSGFELYREYDATGNIKLARETLHLMDDRKRIALVETKTADASAAASSLPSTATRYQFDNHLGTACLELDETGAVISYEEYYPFGSTSHQAGRSAAEVGLKRYRYTGKERDEETGLSYHGARYYANWLGRWTSCDPIGLKAGPNVYQYVRNNPVKLVDPTGTQDCTASKYVCDPGSHHNSDKVSQGRMLLNGLKSSIDANNPLAQATAGAIAGQIFERFSGPNGSHYYAASAAKEKALGTRLGLTTEEAADLATLVRPFAPSDSRLQMDYAGRQGTRGNLAEAEAAEKLAIVTEPGSGFGGIFAGIIGIAGGTAADMRAAAQAGSLLEAVGMAGKGSANPAIVEQTVPSVPKATNTEPTAGSYREVRGHHVHQSASFAPTGPSSTGNTNHQDAIAIRQGVPSFTGGQHEITTAAQRNVNRAYQGQTYRANVGNLSIEASGSGTLTAAPSLHFEDSKAFYALRASGVPADVALKLVLLSRAQIVSSGASPVRVPSR